MRKEDRKTKDRLTKRQFVSNPRNFVVLAMLANPKRNSGKHKSRKDKYASETE